MCGLCYNGAVNDHGNDNGRPSRAVTIADVAAHAGVSRQTVSRAINGLGEISAATRQRVLAAVQGEVLRLLIFDKADRDQQQQV